MAGIGLSSADMRIEAVPLIIGVVVALIGLALIFDAWTPDDIVVKRERRRRPRLERSRGGEAAIGMGMLGMAAAILGRDTWKYSVIAVMVGTVLLFYGALRNRHYFGQAIANRGSTRRRQNPPGSFTRKSSH